MSQQKKIVLFDGTCNFCSYWVQYLLKHERNQELYFASLQSDKGIELLKEYNLYNKGIDSVVFINGEKAYVKSGAALRLTTFLKGLYPILIILLAVPRFIRDWGYDVIAKNRYNFKGKSESCFIPNENERKRFLA